MLALLRDVRAEDTLSYKYQHYTEDDGRIKVTAHYARAEHVWGTGATSLAVQGVHDTITGASPSGAAPAEGVRQVPLSTVQREIRRGALAELKHTLARHALTAQLSYSTESDYVSRGFALTDVIDFNQHNTALQIGWAHTDDDVEPRFFSSAREKKTDDFIVGVTQTLDKFTTITANFTFSTSRGYLADPYKIITKNTELAPGLFLPLTFAENRPDGRDKRIVYLQLNHFVAEANGAIEASYRYFRDTWDIDAHTWQFAWLQKIGDRVTLIPSVRYHRQGAANFYRTTLSDTAIVPGATPQGTAPFYSADYRIAELEAATVALKLVVSLGEHVTADVAWSRYRMSGRDQGRTHASAFPTASILDAGFHLRF